MIVYIVRIPSTDDMPAITENVIVGVFSSEASATKFMSTCNFPVSVIPFEVQS